MSDKVIIASFGKTRTARTATQFQYNHGQKLQFENVDLPANYEVHFSNSVNGEAKTRMGDSTGVVIPPEYFVPGTTIYAWIYVTDEDSGITIRKVEIPISVKAKPTDQPLEPEDESLVEQVVNRLNETIDEIPNKIDQALEDAKESGEFNGPKGDPFTYDDFTPEQLEGLKGPKGDSFTYDDFTPEQLEGLKGPKGDSFTYDDFTPEELEELTGPQGPEGSTIWTTNTTYSYSQETGRYYFAASNLKGPTTATKKLYDLVYLSDDTNKEYKAFYIVEFQYGGLQVGCRYLANMQGPPGEGATGAVLYNQAQALSESEKNRARQNIGAASISDLGVVFRLKGEVNNVSDLPSTGNRVGDIYFVRSKSVGYVWLETYTRPDGYWEELGEPIDISNLPDTITWFAGTVDADDHFTPDEYLTIQNIVMAISNNRLPIIAASFSDGIIIKLPLLHYSFTNSANDYFVFYTVTSGPSKARLQPIKPLSEFYRISYYKELATGGTLVWRKKYDHGYFVESETIGDLSDLNTTDKSSVINAINELDSGKLPTTSDAYRALSIPMGQLDDTSTATVMTATIPGITELRDGVCIWLKNGVVTSASGFTININGLGAKPCYSSLAAATRATTAFNVNYTFLLVYNSTRVNGGCWDLVYGYDTNTTYTPPKLGFGYAVCSTPATTVAKTAAISSYALTTGGIVAIKFDNDVPAGATLNITSKGAKAIYYKGMPITAGIIKAGDTVTMIYSTYYHVISIDRDEAPVTSVNGQTGAVTVTEPFTVTYSTSDMTNWTCNKTYTQIITAAMSGSPVVCNVVVAGNPALQISSVDVGSSMELIFRQHGGHGNSFQIEHYSTDIIISNVATIDPSDIGAVSVSQDPVNANKVLMVDPFGAVVPEDRRFVVTLTPTNSDFSGVMDKTCAEITAAYEAGKDIWLEVDATALGYELWRVKATIEAKVSGENYGQVMGFLINLQLTPPSMIFIFTEFNASGDENLYTTQIYPLASGQWTGGSY